MRGLIIVALCSVIFGCYQPAPNDVGHGYYVRTLVYQGHTYLVFKGLDFGSTVIHDPDCPMEYKK